MVKPPMLPDIPLLSSLTEADRKTLWEGMAETRYDRAQYISKEGDPTECVYVLVSGTVKCVKLSAEGKEAVLKVLSPGDLFCCEAAAFDGTPHPGYAQPMGPVTVLKIPKQTYFKLLREHPEAALKIIKCLGYRLNEAQETCQGLRPGTITRSLAVFNGGVFKYHPFLGGKPLEAKPGERVRVYLVNAGPNNFSAFPPIGEIWENAWASGNPANRLTGVQMVVVGPGDAYTVDVVVQHEGAYPLVTHSLTDALRGAIAVLVVKKDVQALPLMPYVEPGPMEPKQP
jgi:CRP-like cAMP-binding protein